MNRSIVFYLVSRLALINGLALLIPLLAALWWGEAGLVYFAPALAAALLAAAFCRYRGRHHKRHLGPGEGAWYMVSAWFLLGLLGMIPYVMAGTFASPVDAFFESVSAFTTTGTSCLADGGAGLPQSLLLWHSLMEWLGGLNFILLLVSVMPQVSGNFLLYWKSWERRDFKSLFCDAEWRTFLTVVVVTGCLVSFHLWRFGVYDGWDNLRYGFFQVLSFISTSGFSSAAYSTWPEFDKYVLFALAFVGGCIGSATGGLKVMRFMVLFKMAAQEMRRTLHPHMVISLKIDGVPVDMKIISRVLSYFFLFMATFFVSMLIISLSGVTPMQAMGMAVGCLSSVGSTMDLFGVADVSVLPAWTKLYCSFLMILGRVEIFSFLVVIQTAFGYLRRRW